MRDRWPARRLASEQAAGEVPGAVVDASVFLREMPAWSAAALKVGHVRATSADGVAPGSTSDDPLGTTALAPNRSLPVKAVRTVAAAAENVLWPDTYSGNGGVITSGRKYGSHVSAAMSRVPW